MNSRFSFKSLVNSDPHRLRFWTVPLVTRIHSTLDTVPGEYTFFLTLGSMITLLKGERYKERDEGYQDNSQLERPSVHGHTPVTRHTRSARVGWFGRTKRENEGDDSLLCTKIERRNGNLVGSTEDVGHHFFVCDRRRTGGGYSRGFGIDPD